MRIFSLDSTRVLVLAAMAAVCCRGLAQFDPVVPTLSPSAATTISTTPVTTLSTDLLTAPRPFVFDQTGANILATVLTPEVDAGQRNLASSETDTALRDSAQTGQINPYMRGASRLGVSFTVNSGSSNSRFGGSLPPEAEPESDADASGRSASYASTSDYRSRWGSSSAFVSRSARPSWIAGLNDSTSLNSVQPRSALDQESSANLASAAPLDRRDRPFTSTHTVPLEKMRRTASTGSARTRMDSTAPTQPPVLFQSGGRSPEELRSRTQNSTSFSLFSHPAPDFSFGTSPFSSPSGIGQMTFLDPDSLRQLASTGGGTARRIPNSRSKETGSSSRGRAAALETSRTGYGLDSHLRRLGARSAREFDKRHKNPYLSPSLSRLKP